VSGVDLAAILAFVNARLNEREAAAEAGIHAVGCAILEDDPRNSCDCGWSAFALDDIAAKRRLLDLHEPIPSCSAGILQCRYRADICHSGSGLSCDSPDAPYPCPTVRLVSAPFAQHPDYDPAWAVAGEQS
jgi:hypothetical protein